MGETKIIPVKGITKIVGDLMRESAVGFGQARQFLEVDMRQLEKVRAHYAEKGVKLMTTAILAKAAAVAMADFPEANARLEGENILRYEDVNPGIAVETSRGLISVVLKEVQKKDLIQVNEELRALIEKANTNKLTYDDIHGSTVTISSLSSIGVDFLTSIVTNFEAMIISFGKTKKRPVVDENDQIVARPTSWVTANFNHSIIGGSTSAGYLCRFGEILEKAEEYFI
jgi:2-oxoisovalerate dehydrogenase E2 component (dihydrolipoyl transacylase)